MLFDDEFAKMAANGIKFKDMSGNEKIIIGNCVFTSAGYHPIEEDQQNDNVQTQKSSIGN